MKVPHRYFSTQPSTKRARVHVMHAACSTCEDYQGCRGGCHGYWGDETEILQIVEPGCYRRAADRSGELDPETGCTAEEIDAVG